MLLDALSGDQLRDSALFIVATPEAARFINNETIERLVEAATDSEAVGRVTSIISSRHEVRAFNTDTLTRIRDTLLASDDGRIRQHALAIDREIPGSGTFRRLTGCDRADKPPSRVGGARIASVARPVRQVFRTAQEPAQGELA